MKVSLGVHAYVAAGMREIDLPATRICPLPPPGAHPRKPRLPGLAIDMARMVSGSAGLDSIGEGTRILKEKGLDWMGRP